MTPLIMTVWSPNSRSSLLPGLLGKPAVVYRWGHGGGNRGGADVSDEDQGLFQRMIHPQHLISPLNLLCWLLHQTALVPSQVQVGHQLRVDKVLRLEVGEERGEKRLSILRFCSSSDNAWGWTNRRTLLIMRCMMVLGMRSVTDL